MHVFTYGTLMFDDIWNLLITTAYEKETATLHGYTRRAVVDETYPVIFQAEKADSVQGILYLNVSDEDITVLDRFEGEYYIRHSLTVVSENGMKKQAGVYVLNDRYRHIVSEQSWKPEAFKKHSISRFINNYAGFNK